jgi:hypothetical protein
MKVNLADLRIREIIIHPIRRWNSANGQDLPKQSPANSLSAIDVEERTFLQEKIAEAGVKTRIHEIRPSPQQIRIGNLQPQRILNLLKGKGNLVADSMEMVHDLAAAQDKQTGHDYLLLVGTGDCKGVPVVIMFTMQGEQAIQAIDTPGRPIKLEKIKSLVLNKKARLEKMVAFEVSGTHAVGIVEDSVMKGGAQYFLEGFLGCETAEKSWRHSQMFFKATLATINTHVSNEGDKVALTDALYAEIRAPQASIDIQAFADKYVKASYRPAFEQELAKRNLSLTVISKDTRLIEPDLKALTYQLTNGITIRLSSDTPEGSVKAMHDSEEGDYLKVKGSIKRVGRGTARKPAKKKAMKKTKAKGAKK